MVLAAYFLILLTQPAAPLPARPFISATTGGLRGQVHDEKEHPVPGVQVSLRAADGHCWVATTNEQGEFKAGELPPGEYLVELTKARHPTASYPKVLIKAQAWLRGVATRPHEAPKPGYPQLRLIGPATYESPTALFMPVARPKTEKIPMH